MIRTVDKFTGVTVIDMFQSMFSPSIIRMAARDVKNNNRFNTLAKKYCGNDINIKGVYPYLYLQTGCISTAYVFVYGRRDIEIVDRHDKDDLNIPHILSNSYVDTLVGDNVIFLYPDEIERCKDYDIIRFELFCEIEGTCGFPDITLEEIIGLVSSNHILNQRYKDEWYKEILRGDMLEEKGKLDHLLEIFKDYGSSEVVREINYGETDYSVLKGLY